MMSYLIMYTRRLVPNMMRYLTIVTLFAMFCNSSLSVHQLVDHLPFFSKK
jgi:hypothetical protein